MLVLVALDGSAHARHALNVALFVFPSLSSSPLWQLTLRSSKMARADQEFLLVAVSKEVPFDQPTSAQRQKAEDAVMEGELTLRGQEVAGAGFKVRTSLRHGDPREEINKSIEETGAELVVLGSRGLNAVSKLLLGSVSECAHRPWGIVRSAR